MLPPIAMLTTKKPAQIFLIFSVGILMVLGATGCAPAGARALAKGERLLKEGKYSEAVKRFEEAADALPDNAKAWNHLGLGYQYADEPKKAAQAYQRALSLDRNLAAARYNLGALHLEQRNFSGAISDLTTFIQLEPKNPDGWFKLGLAQMQLASRVSSVEKNRLLDTAKKNLETAQKLQPSAGTLNALGMVAIQRGRARDGAQNFAAALRQEPDYPPALLNLAIVYQQNFNDPRLALVNYKKFLQVAKNSPDAREVQLAVRQLEAQLNPPPAVAAHPAPVVSSKPPVQSNPPAPAPTPAPTAPPPKTETQLPRAVVIPKSAPVISSPKAQPPSPKKETPVQVTRVPDETPPPRPAREVVAPSRSKPVAPNSKSNVATANPKRETNAPQKSTGVLAKLNPANWFKKKPAPTPTPLPAIKPTIESNATDVSSESNTTAKIESIPRYRYRSPRRPAEGNRATAESFFAQGVKAQRDKRWLEAISAYQNALQKDPGFFGAYFNLGMVAREAGDLSAALNAYEYALAITPDSADARYNFAYTLQEAGYFQDAAIELRKLLALNPKETRARLLLGNLYSQRLGQPSAAREQYLKVLEADPQHPQATQIRYWLAAHP